MGWLKNVGRAVTKGLKDTGHAIGNAQNNPWVKGAEAAALTASGVGAPAAALILGGAGLAGGAMRSGGGLKGALTEGGQGALTGAAAGLTGSALRQVGSKIAGTVAQKALPSGAAPTDPSGMTEDQFYNSIPGGATAPAVAAAGSGAGNALTSVGSALLPKNPDGSINWGKALQGGLAIGAGVEGMQNSRKASQYENKALDAASADYNAKAPLRTQAYASLLNPTKADDSGLFDPTNPYARKLPVVGGGTSAAAQRFPMPPTVAPDASQAAQLSNVVQRSMATARQRMAQAGVI